LKEENDLEVERRAGGKTWITVVETIKRPNRAMYGCMVLTHLYFLTASLRWSWKG